jgi:type I restriction-modification system DNA methylase subunit
MCPPPPFFIIHPSHLAWLGCSTSSTTSRPTALAGFVLANGSMSSNQSGEADIRRAIVEADLVDCMVTLASWQRMSNGEV